MKNSNSYFFLVLMALVMNHYSCAPVFNELQTAQMVGKGNVEIFPSFSSVSVTEDGETDNVQNQLGIQGGYGISDKVELRFRYEYVYLTGENDFSDGLSVIGFGPKVSLIENRLAFSLPIGRPFGNDDEDFDEMWEIHPTIMCTLPISKDQFDLTMSSKYLIRLESDVDNLIAFNLGAAIGTNLNNWSIRPEFEILFNPGESGNAKQLSIAFSKTFRL